MFTKSTCKYCAEAKQKLAQHSIEVYEIRLDEGSEAERAEIRELLLRVGTTVPQIYLGLVYVGPNSELQKMTEIVDTPDVHPVWLEAQAIRMKHALVDRDF